MNPTKIVELIYAVFDRLGAKMTALLILAVGIWGCDYFMKIPDTMAFQTMIVKVAGLTVLGIGFFVTRIKETVIKEEKKKCENCS